MKATITITWDPSLPGETKITYSKGWEALTQIEKADNLKDSLGVLTEKYNTTIDKGLICGAL